ncbi:hypothetical protein GCM10008995_23180 [Halobellus salinus]|uniref:DUF8080 domain-containing protein n=1 Tax=Halobellus salinus TaxID=931585 RepID=A0A830EJZ6_9EURY|nr:hypothetical protein [Halobellus salinus]GGJ12692.1 hypothetical protein GCM10008995_23180 [Halobellus salinus]SMP28820.1 hypothetical protein SAMN06265347_11412 [Halobellus salinus]
MAPDSPDASTGSTDARPVRADVTTTATAGGVLVAVTLRNDTAVAVRVRVENDLDGPVLPPRQEGVPAVGWDEDGFSGTVPADSRVGIGYACPTADGDAAEAAPADPGLRSDPDRGVGPVSLDVLGPADADEPRTTDRVSDAVRSLGRATPPADAVPTPPTVNPDAPVADRRARCPDERTDSNLSDVPDSVVAWLDAAETRIERAERLAGATADEAAAVLEGCGVDGVADLPDDLDGDIAALRAVRYRLEDLLGRATTAEPAPVVSPLVAAAGGDTSAGARRLREPEALRTDGTSNSDSGGRR